jgi:hypothetical protein
VAVSCQYDGVTPRSTTWRLANDRLDGKLAELLLEMRGRGLSFDEIALSFAVDHDLRLASETYRSWVRILEDSEAVA